MRRMLRTTAEALLLLEADPCGDDSKKSNNKGAKRLPGFSGAALVPRRFAEVVPAVMSAHQLSGFRVDGD